MDRVTEEGTYCSPYQTVGSNIDTGTAVAAYADLANQRDDLVDSRLQDPNNLKSFTYI